MTITSLSERYPYLSWTLDGRCYKVPAGFEAPERQPIWDRPLGVGGPRQLRFEEASKLGIFDRKWRYDHSRRRLYNVDNHRLLPIEYAGISEGDVWPSDAVLDQRWREYTATKLNKVKDPDKILVTDPDTGGQKEQSHTRFDLIPAAALKHLANVYGKNAKPFGKYDPNNWRKGYAWSSSLAALQRHINAWQLGEDIDPEDGEPHLAHAAWHCLTLITFAEENLGKDDVRA